MHIYCIGNLKSARDRVNPSRGPESLTLTDDKTITPGRYSSFSRSSLGDDPHFVSRSRYDESTIEVDNVRHIL